MIGTNAAGTAALTNHVGIDVRGSSNIMIGGTAPGARNVISGNYIGTAADGSAALGNGGGVLVGGSSNMIGGTEPGAGNRIAHSRNWGVLIDSGSRNSILGNSIFNSNDSGITLDAGTNNSQTSPVLTSAGVRVNTTVHGTLNSTPGRQFRMELFSNTACDPSGSGEGETFLGLVNATTDGAGNASFIATFPPIPELRFITATATDLTTNDTSEFSACRQVRAAALSHYSSSDTTTEANEGGAYDGEVLYNLATLTAANVTVPVSVSDSTEARLVSSSPLTFTPANGTTPQAIRVLGVDDGIDDGDVVFTVVVGPTSSADPNYNGLGTQGVPILNVDNDDRFGAMCRPRPKVNVSVTKIGSDQLRVTITIGVNSGTQNELVAITWTRLDTATVVLNGVGPVQQGQQTAFATPLTQSASFMISRTPGASSGTVRLVVTDGCGDWPTFVGGGPNAW